jgi:hypothetical protein
MGRRGSDRKLHLRSGGKMSEQRISLDDLRARIKPYNDAVADWMHPLDWRDSPPDYVQRVLGFRSDAWQAAYLWHVGVTNDLIAAFAERDMGSPQASYYEALSRERREGMTLIRERVRP